MRWSRRDNFPVHSNSELKKLGEAEYEDGVTRALAIELHAYRMAHASIRQLPLDENDLGEGLGIAASVDYDDVMVRLDMARRAVR